MGQELYLYENHNQNAYATQIQMGSFPSGSNLKRDELVSSKCRLLPIMKHIKLLLYIGVTFLSIYPWINLIQ